MQYVLAPFVLLGFISKLINKSKKNNINIDIVQSKKNTNLYQLTTSTPDKSTCNTNGSNPKNEIHQNKYQKEKT